MHKEAAELINDYAEEIDSDDFAAVILAAFFLDLDKPGIITELYDAFKSIDVTDDAIRNSASNDQKLVERYLDLWKHKLAKNEQLDILCLTELFDADYFTGRALYRLNGNLKHHFIDIVMEKDSDWSQDDVREYFLNGFLDH